ncbi:FemAB family protein [Gelidibacter algens]|uniref:FemAB family protein n=1 Tax=Gelidibacter algens TaxID=49280 RepID=A0A1A7R3B3_9FLAO|nr:peptidoglycan bridge formation glycyltransferase FemA/FemB family protein [Gelidibacter algens]OBX26750.1 hypothetical protein A9996_02770 [Gelidibacter algens]RAJ22805.1 FemAB family protein [Gelidibacter algens]
MIEVIKDKNQWIEQLSLIENLDFHHTYDYHDLSKKEDELPILIKYTEGLTSLALPLLIRSIKNSDYKDATSVYGYAGILTLNLDQHFNRDDFYKELNVFFNDHKIVSVFSRLHPYLEYQEALLGGLGTITTLGKVVYIDLKDSLENQRNMFNRRMKTYLNKSRKTCKVIESKLPNHLESFIHLYHDNMRRVDADDSYYFDKNYFDRLMSSKEFKSRLMLCLHIETETVIGGALFIEKGKMVQYHLSGLDDDYFDLNPIKLIIDEMRIQSTQQQFEFLNLGGGRGSKEDSLFTFKTSFSKHFKEFKIWKYVVNEKVYRTLVEKHLGTRSETEVSNDDFFPAYRLENEHQKFE